MLSSDSDEKERYAEDIFRIRNWHYEFEVMPFGLTNHPVVFINQMNHSSIHGTRMFVVMKKLKAVKVKLKALNKQSFSELHVSETTTYHVMIAAQELMHQRPGNEQYSNAKLVVVKEYIQKHQAYVEFLKQKAKVEWIEHSDEMFFIRV